MGSSSSKGGVQFFPGQKEFAGKLFDSGGFFDQILAGKPNAAFEAGADRSAQALDRSFAGRGLTGSGLETRALSDFQSEVSRKREGDLFSRVLSGIQPAGSFSSSGSLGLFTK